MRDPKGGVTTSFPYPMGAPLMKTFEIDLEDTPERWQQVYAEVERAILEGEVESPTPVPSEALIWPYWSCT